jgi:hypothetical protein
MYAGGCYSYDYNGGGQEAFQERLREAQARREAR